MYEEQMVKPRYGNLHIANNLFKKLEIIMLKIKNIKSRITLF